ncbi:Tail-specific protease precursor [compost metagenome]
MDKIGEDTEPSALPWDEVRKSNFTPVANLTPVKAELARLHQQRMDRSLDYKMLQEDLAEAKKSRDDTSISLNEAKLKAERDSVETKNLAKINALRASRGLSPVKKGDKVKKEENYDFIQDESLKIVADLMNLTNTKGNAVVKTKAEF